MGPRGHGASAPPAALAGHNALDLGSATRVYWTFKVLGHDKVSILDGGMAAYQAAEAPTARQPQPPPQKTFVARVREDMLIGKEDVARAIQAGTVLVDHRPSHMYLGITRPGPVERSGTLPGARNLPEAWLTENDGGKLRAPDTLARLYEFAGVPTRGEQIAFCNTGHWASLGWFASSEIMGNPDVTVYDGSMVEWSRDPDLPMEVKVAL
jgi:thiosulfate/3-mercaptopyruvate sulfurtransferase